jgi:hypothetical protein
MQQLDIDGLTFTFPDGWQAGKYDEWSFYRNQFVKQGDGIKAVDAVVMGPENQAFLIEVKDYRHPDTEKPSQLPDAIANKVLCTLAALLPAKLKANVPAEQQLAAAILGCASLRVIAHIEQPRRHRPAVDLADIKQKLRKLLRAVDAHPNVVSMNSMDGIAWSVV